MAEIKEELRVRGSSPVGSRSLLIDRLNAIRQSEQSSPVNSDTGIVSDGSSSGTPAKRSRGRPPRNRTPLFEANSISRESPARSMPAKTDTLHRLAEEHIGFWKTLIFACGNLVETLVDVFSSIPSWFWKVSTASVALVVAVLAFLPERSAVLTQAARSVVWYAYWMLLGAENSLSFTTKNTLRLRLAPFVARVTNAARSCGRVDFDVFGAAAFQCKQSVPPTSSETADLLNILVKVYFEIFSWSFGSVLAEGILYGIGTAMPQTKNSDFFGLEVLAPVSVFLHHLGFLVFDPRRKYFTMVMGMFPALFSELSAFGAGYFGVPLQRFLFTTFVGRLTGGLFRALVVIIAFSPRLIVSLRNSLFPSPRLALFIEYAMSQVRSALIRQEPLLGRSFDLLRSSLVVILSLVIFVHVARSSARIYRSKLLIKASSRHHN